MSELININGVEFESARLHTRVGGLQLVPDLHGQLDVEPWMKENPQAIITAVRRASAITIANSGHSTPLTEHWSPGTKLDVNQIVQWHSDEGEGVMVALVGAGEGTATSLAKREDIFLAMQANVEFLNPANLPFVPGHSVQDYLTIVRVLYQDLLSSDTAKHRSIVNRFNNICIQLSRVSLMHADTWDYAKLLSWLNVFADMVNKTANDNQAIYDHNWRKAESSTLLMWTGANYLSGESDLVHRRARKSQPGTLSRYDYKRAVLESNGSFHNLHWHDLF